jgi:hypothetical protein
MDGTVPLVGTRDMNASEVARGERFEFGGNWGDYLTRLEED